MSEFRIMFQFLKPTKKKRLAQCFSCKFLRLLWKRKQIRWQAKKVLVFIFSEKWVEMDNVCIYVCAYLFHAFSIFIIFFLLMKKRSTFLRIFFFFCVDVLIKFHPLTRPSLPCALYFHIQSITKNLVHLIYLLFFLCCYPHSSHLCPGFSFFS